MGDFRGVKPLGTYKDFTIFQDGLTYSGDYFYLAMGPFFASQTIHKELGGPIYNAPPYEWLIAYNVGVVAGFVSAFPMKDRHWWLDAGYVGAAYRQQGLYRYLFEARLLAVKEAGGTFVQLATCSDIVRHVCRRHNFTPYRDRGRWTYYERALV